MRPAPIIFTAILILAGLGMGVAHAFSIDKAMTKPDGNARLADPDEKLTGDPLSGAPSASPGRPTLRIVPNTGSSYYSQQDAQRERELFPGGNGSILPPGRR
jgi:hypothetical protein